jgi:hypothetical protein
MRIIAVVGELDGTAVKKKGRDALTSRPLFVLGDALGALRI